jgi:anti-sigma regulatory factor (Ser/Thr protein kinase)
MIDLSRTRVALLAEIEAPTSGGPRYDITDPEVLNADACVELRGHSRGALFRPLKVTLSERFAAVPRLVLIRDLLMPLRHALGNAAKHGNGRDRTKAIMVELVMTAKGALITVTDEGDGFEVGSLVERLHQHETYFVNHGDGFRNFHRASSTVTWEDGGRTILLCFRPAFADRSTPWMKTPTSTPRSVGRSIRHGSGRASPRTCPSSVLGKRSSRPAMPT